MQKSIPLKKSPREAVARMGDLATLPVFLKLRGKTALLAGGSPGTAWKAELLAAAGARVHLVWDQPDAETLKLVAEWPDRIMVSERRLEEADFDGAAVAIGALEGDAEAAQFAAVARAKGIPVNVVDKPAFCDFQFGAIVNRSPLVIGISTDGGAPPLGQAIRSMIETLLPAGLSQWAAAAKSWRLRVMNAGLDGSGRKTFWRQFAKQALARPNHVPCPVEREAMIAALEHRDASSARGHLALVGAGPGDPELLTLKAVRFLREADVILYDDLVSEGVLAFGRREARKIHVGKRGGEPSCIQTDISSLAVLLATEGHRVVRLKGGDPLVFGRADEEILAARNAGVAIDIVNGISAAQGAAAALSTSLTRRSVARRVQFVTAHAENGTVPDSLDWASIASKDATTCVYMGRRLVGAFLEKAIAAGLAPQTQARFVINATLPNQSILEGTVSSIASKISASPVTGPGVMIFGDALNAHDSKQAVTLLRAAE
jgi:uroporphyrin-III C-methyltransferase / precorrin-2 dehydrogenase / sirohydrochlorin ferrochelatase